MRFLRMSWGRNENPTIIKSSNRIDRGKDSVGFWGLAGVSPASSFAKGYGGQVAMLRRGQAEGRSKKEKVKKLDPR
jgi:hypothetical protein